MAEERMVDLTFEEIKAREAAVAADVANRNAKPQIEPAEEPAFGLHDR